MSVNLKELLNKLGVKDEDGSIYESLTSETLNSDAVQTILKASQDYSKPFLELDFNTKIDSERKTWKGKYFQDAARQANKEFGNKLTNSEIEDIMADPANEGKTYQAVISAIKAKTTSSGDTAQLQEMLDKANGKIGEYETKMNELQTKHKEEFDNYVKTGKLNSKLKDKLISIVKQHTSMDAAEAADFVQMKINQRASLKLNDQDEIDLFDLNNPESKLRKSDTEFQTLEGLATEIITNAKLPTAQSNGVQKVSDTPAQNEQTKQIYKNSSLGAAEQLATALSE